jgi:hypothetical protein
MNIKNRIVRNGKSVLEAERQEDYRASFAGFSHGYGKDYREARSTQYGHAW